MVRTPIPFTENLPVGKTATPLDVHEMVATGKLRGVEQMRIAVVPLARVVLGPMDTAKGGPVLRGRSG